MPLIETHTVCKNELPKNTRDTMGVLAFKKNSTRARKETTLITGPNLAEILAAMLPGQKREVIYVHREFDLTGRLIAVTEFCAI